MSAVVPRVLCALCLLGAAACTGSENQLFLQLPTQPPSGPPEKDAEPPPPAADGGGLDDDDAGVLQINPWLDPDATFVWVETQPGHPGACEAGTYSGSFECTFDEQGGFARMLGSVELTLEPDADTSELIITEARMRGFIDGTLAAFSSSLEGALDCGTARVMATTASSKTFTLPSDWGGHLESMTIDGSLDGAFDAEALSLTGQAELHTSEGWQCAGTFRAQIAR
jgi:hypothetical protein